MLPAAPRTLPLQAIPTDAPVLGRCEPRSALARKQRKEKEGGKSRLAPWYLAKVGICKAAAASQPSLLA